MSDTMVWSFTYAIVIFLFLILFVDWRYICPNYCDNEENIDYVIV